MSSTTFHSTGGGLEPGIQPGGLETGGPIFTLGADQGPASHHLGRRKGAHGKHSPSSSHAHKHLPRSASAASRSGISDAGAAGAGGPAPIFSASASVGPPQSTQPAPAAPAFGSSQPGFHIGSSAGSPTSARKPWGRSQSARQRSNSAFPKETAPLESLFAAAVATPLPQTSTAEKQQLPVRSSAAAAAAAPSVPTQPTQPPTAPLQPSSPPPAAPAPTAVPLPSASLAAAAAAAAKAPCGVQQAAKAGGSSAPAENGPAVPGERP
eukprot:1150964-Pelagomonas_calceolata.AAC.8